MLLSKETLVGRLPPVVKLLLKSLNKCSTAEINPKLMCYLLTGLRRCRIGALSIGFLPEGLVGVAGAQMQADTVL